MTDSAFLERSRYYLAEEYPQKIRLAIEKLDEQDVWKRANAESNSIGNLLAHLAGNIRQWIVCGVGEQPDSRNRAAEFAAREGPGKDELLARLQRSIDDADSVLAELSQDDLPRRVTIQGRETTLMAAIYHVVEHFSMHTGQIILLSKAALPGAFKFYDSTENAIPLWGGHEGTSRHP